MTKGSLPLHAAAGIMAEMMKEAEFKPPEINKCQVFILLLISINIYMKGEWRRHLHLQQTRNEDLAWTGLGGDSLSPTNQVETKRCE